MPGGRLHVCRRRGMIVQIHRTPRVHGVLIGYIAAWVRGRRSAGPHRCVHIVIMTEGRQVWIVYDWRQNSEHARLVWWCRSGGACPADRVAGRRGSRCGGLDRTHVRGVIAGCWQAAASVADPTVHCTLAQPLCAWVSCGGCGVETRLLPTRAAG